MALEVRLLELLCCRLPNLSSIVRILLANLESADGCNCLSIILYIWHLRNPVSARSQMQPCFSYLATFHMVKVALSLDKLLLVLSWC